MQLSVGSPRTTRTDTYRAYQLIRSTVICMRTKETEIETHKKWILFVARLYSFGRSCVCVWVCDSRARLHIADSTMVVSRVRFLCGFFCFDVVVGHTHTHTRGRTQPSAKKTCNSCLNIFVLRCNSIYSERNTITIFHQDAHDAVMIVMHKNRMPKHIYSLFGCKASAKMVEFVSDASLRDGNDSNEFVTWTTWAIDGSHVHIRWSK